MFINYGPAQVLLDTAKVALAILEAAKLPGILESDVDRFKKAIQTADDAVNITEPELLDAIQRARDAHESDDLEIDDKPVLSESEHGTWVSAWVWVEWVDSEDEPSEEGEPS